MSEERHVYRFWNKEEDAMLIEAWHQCKTLTEIATLLNDTRGDDEPYRTSDTVRMRVQTLRKHGHNLPVRLAALQRWRHKHAALDAVQSLMAANRAEKARLRALRDELKNARAAHKAAMEAQKEAERLEREEKAALENLKGWPPEGVLLFTDNLTKAELDRENVWSHPLYRNGSLPCHAEGSVSLMDWSTQAGARELARRITLYWLERGYTPTVKVEPMLVAMSDYSIHERDRDRIFVVRSDLGRELPKRPR